MKIYLSKPGYDGTRALRWSDLELIHSERFTRARTDWQTPPTIAGASGFFEVKAPLPANRSGDAVLYVRWQREDPAGEGFYNCSDISFNDTGIPQPELHEKGPFIPAEIQPKPGDTVRFRILGSSEDAAEIVDVRQEITAANSTPNVWGKQIFLKVAPTVAVIGEPLEGRARSNAIKFNETDHRANLVFVRNKNDSPAMSIFSGGGGDPEPVDPRPPVARIDGLSTVKSGDIFTLNGSGSIGYNGPLVYQWVVPWTTLDPNQSSVRLTAPTVTEATTYEVLLGVLDEKNKTRHQAEHRVTVSPASAGEYPAYSPADLSKYNPGTIISNHGKNYQCKPFPEGGWCKQSPPHYEPGAGSNWTDAWNVY